MYAQRLRGGDGILPFFPRLRLEFETPVGLEFSNNSEGATSSPPYETSSWLVYRKWFSIATPEVVGVAIEVPHKAIVNESVQKLTVAGSGPCLSIVQ